jgi:small-conductance mechanosensitive channel
VALGAGERDELVEELWRRMDRNEDGTVTRGEWVATFEDIFVEWKNGRQTLSGLIGASAAVQWFTLVISILVDLVAVLLVFRVDLSGVFLPVASIILSLSFALGGPLSDTVRSIIFVVVSRPFDTGDRVTLSGLNQNQTTLIVREIGAYQTAFTTVLGTRTYIPNFQLAQMTIQNHRRSDDATVEIQLSVNANTSASQVAALRERILAHLIAHDKLWKPSVFIAVLSCSLGPQNLLTLGIWVTCRSSLQFPLRVHPPKLDLTLDIMAACRTLGIRYVLPPQPLRIEGSSTNALQIVLQNAGARGGHQDSLPDQH